jgi:Ca2+-binding EF-hand superfamily protein
MSKRNKAKETYLILLALFLIILATFVMLAYGANKILAGQAQKLSTQRAVSEALGNQQTALTKNKQDLIKYKDLNDIAKTVVPQDKDQAEAVREIVNIASQSGIRKLTSVTFPSSTLGVAAGAKGNQLTPVKGISGVYDLQITITQTSDKDNPVTYSQFLAFLRGLEQNRRTAQVSSINVQPDTTGNDRVGFTLVIDEYIKP